MYDWPNTITFIVALRMKYDSYLELIEVPPEEWWDYPHYIRMHIDRIYPKNKNPDHNIPLENFED